MAMATTTRRRRRAVVSFTGGKDCHLALARAREREDLEVAGLACFHPPGIPKFKAHPLRVQEQQAEALGLPLWTAVVDADAHEGSYLAAYGAAMAGLRRAHGVEVIVTGDIDLVGSSKTNFIADVCAQTACGLTCWLPLWEISRRAALDEMLERGFDIRFSCVKSPHFDAEWIGRRLDAAALAEMAPMEPDGLDLCGENGEYHTVVLDGGEALYKTARLVPRVGPEAEELVGHPGQTGDQRWWTIRMDDNGASPYVLCPRASA